MLITLSWSPKLCHQGAQSIQDSSFKMQILTLKKLKLEDVLHF